ncbi:MAG: energy-coupling factor ABC transporter ATP-binding protein [Spirochaetes bacterium]|nr:energy-coupling factor ABC transporter ATP-binding protein [Spirochaetota bacterium]MBU1081514.1 energy-coupling factor ABC transporter ATP-binding protein [Spirochaetota bacterium]
MTAYGLELDSIVFAYPDGERKTTASPSGDRLAGGGADTQSPPVLDGASLGVAPGAKVGILGANGSGKSTLLGIIAGLHEPRAGTVRVGDILVAKKTLKAARLRLGFVFQDPDDQLFTGSVYDDVAFGPRNAGLSDAEVRERVESALATVGIPELAERPPFRLSGGEKRMAAIATVLSMDPGILVLDEPSAALDPKARRRLIRLLSGLPQTVVIATHDLDLALDVCGRAAILHAGRVEAYGDSRAVLGDAALLERCGLEPPLSSGSCAICGRRP